MDSKHSEHQFASVFPLFSVSYFLRSHSPNCTLQNCLQKLSSVCVSVCLSFYLLFLGNTFVILYSVGSFLRQYIKDRTQLLHNLFFVVKGRYFLFNVETTFHSNVKLSVSEIENEMNEEDIFHNFDENCKLQLSRVCHVSDVFCC